MFASNPPTSIPVPSHIQPTWRIGTTAIALLAAVATGLLALPLATVAFSLFQADGGAWQHIASTTLTEMVGNTLLLGLLVAIGTAVVGTTSAWLTARFDWYGRRTFEWLLVLPLAMPAYVMAYAYTDLLQYAGPVQSALREAFGWQAKADYWFFEIRSLPGAAVVLTFALYPYVYLLARAAFLERSASLVEAGRTFGYSRLALMWRLSIPIARPAVAAGVALVLMETFADYGTVSYFGINTFTTGIFNAWFAQGDRVAAAKLATLLLVLVAVILTLERRARRRARFADSRRAANPRAKLGRRGQLAAMVLTGLPVLFGFLLPVLLLARLIAAETQTPLAFAQIEDFLRLAWNSFSLAGVTAVIAVSVSVAFAYAARAQPSLLLRATGRVIGLGYAIPGTVIAVGVLLPVTAIDHKLADGLSLLLGRDTGLILTGGIAVLVYAYLIRFLAISLQTCEAGFSRITPNMDAAARSLGATDRELVTQIHAPLLRTSLLTAGLLVFVDVMKELPATLVMRPFNFDTLAVRTYTLAKDERLAEASVAALAIVLVGLLPVLLASRAITEPQTTSRRG
jgi:iron(III) transport system permease protein